MSVYDDFRKGHGKFVMDQRISCSGWSLGVNPNIHRGIYTHDGDINLLFILVVSTLSTSMHAFFLICDASICS